MPLKATFQPPRVEFVLDNFMQGVIQRKPGDWEQLAIVDKRIVACGLTFVFRCEAYITEV